MTDKIQEEFICSHQKEHHYEFSLTLGISRFARNDMLLDVTLLHFSFNKTWADTWVGPYELLMEWAEQTYC